MTALLESLTALLRVSRSYLMGVSTLHLYITDNYYYYI